MWREMGYAGLGGNDTMHEVTSRELVGVMC